MNRPAEAQPRGLAAFAPLPSQEEIDRWAVAQGPALRLSSTSARSHDADVIPVAPGTAAARLTVYALSNTVLLVTLPVGLMLLAMNMLLGENLRTTSHVTALTGLCLALSMTEHGSRLLAVY